MDSTGANRVASLIAIIAMLVAAGAWFAACYGVSRIDSVQAIFVEFDARIPKITQVLFDLPRPVLWLTLAVAAVAIFAAQFGLAEPHQRITAHLTIGLGLLVGVVLLYMALYMPMFALTQKISQ